MFSWAHLRYSEKPEVNAFLALVITHISIENSANLEAFRIPI
jgi:hypothetical protein